MALFFLKFVVIRILLTLLTIRKSNQIFFSEKWARKFLKKYCKNFDKNFDKNSLLTYTFRELCLKVFCKKIPTNVLHSTVEKENSMESRHVQSRSISSTFYTRVFCTKVHGVAFL